MASSRDCPCDSASCRDSRQEAKSHEQSLQEAVYQAQVSAGSKRLYGQQRLLFLKKWLPAETVRVILLPAETVGRKLNHIDSLCRKLFTKHNSLSRKQEIAQTAETTVLEKWLPLENVRVILLPAETVGRKLNHTDSLCRKLFTKHKSQQGARDCRQSRWKPNMMNSLCRKRKMRTRLYPEIKFVKRSILNDTTCHTNMMSKTIRFKIYV